MDVYPNPASSQRSCFKLEFQGPGFREQGVYRMDLYNLKGQKLLSRAISPDALKEGRMALEAETLPRGILLMSLSKDGARVSARKITVY
jgi:hypothetical protein